MVQLFRRWLLCGWFVWLWGTGCAPTAERVLQTSGIKPYYLRTVLPNTFTAYGSGQDTAEAMREAFYHTRAQVIQKVLDIHQQRMNDPLLTEAELQAHFRQYLLDSAEVLGQAGVHLLGIKIDSQRIRNRYFEYRRNAITGRNYYFLALQMIWPDSLTRAISDHFYRYDRSLSDVVATARFYADKPSDFAMIAFQMRRLQALPPRLRDYRRASADSLLFHYQQLLTSVRLEAVNITSTTVDLVVRADDRHITGGRLLLPAHGCISWNLLREDDGGFHLSYDESHCVPEAAYADTLAVQLPDGSMRQIPLRLPGNRVSLELLGPIVLHYFQESQDGYAELLVQSLSGQHYYIREVHLNGIKLNAATNGLGRNIRGEGRYPLRVPIPAESFKIILKQKATQAEGGLLYTHPTSGRLTDACFTGIPLHIKAYKM